MGMSSGKYVTPATDGDEENGQRLRERERREGEGEDTIHELREIQHKSRHDGREVTIPKPFSDDILESTTRQSHLLPSHSSSSDPVINIVYHTKVPIQHKDYFEKEWLPSMATLYETFQGFKYRSINLLVRTEEVCEYLVIIACSDYQCFLRWESTPQRVEMLELLKFHDIVTRRLDTTSQDPSLPERIQRQQSHSLPLRAYLNEPLGVAATFPSLPPSKWKLSVIIFLGVMMNIYLWSYSGLPVRMAAAGLPGGFNLFVSLAISVPILSYSVFPLVMSIPLVAHWLQSPRPEKMTSLQKLLDQGLQMFAPKGAPGPPKETVAHFKKMECRLEATRRVQHQLSSEIERMKSQMHLSQGHQQRRGSSSSTLSKDAEELHESTRHQVAEGIERSLALRGAIKKSKSTSHLQTLGNAPSPQFNGDEIKEGNHGPITVAVAHWVKWEHILDFELWTEDITSAMAKFPGFLGMTTIIPQSEVEPYINCFTYQTPAQMMAFINSETRKKLLEKLAPLLASEMKVQTVMGRTIGDVFTELFVATGSQAVARPPPVWKTVVLTVIPLHIIVWQLGGAFFKILVGDAHLQFDLALCLNTIMTVVFTSYVGVPIMYLEFGEWLHQERIIDEKDCLSFLDTGLKPRGQVLLLLAWFAFCFLTGYFAQP